MFFFLILPANTSEYGQMVHIVLQNWTVVHLLFSKTN